MKNIIKIVPTIGTELSPVFKNTYLCNIKLSIHKNGFKIEKHTCLSENILQVQF